MLNLYSYGFHNNINVVPRYIGGLKKIRTTYLENSSSILIGYKTLFITTILFVTGLFTLSCSSNLLILENDSDVLNALQSVFYETSYYKYDEAIDIYQLYDNNKSFIGYAFYAESISYDGEFDGEGSKKGTPMKIMVSLHDKNTINRVVVVSHAEDYLFWQLLIDARYLSQFNNLRLEDAYFISDGGKVDCVTGATLSSLSVLDIVRESAAKKVMIIP